MNFEEVIKKQQEEKDIIDRLSILYLSEEDIDVCNYVNTQLRNIDIGNINYGKEISFFDLIYNGLCEMNIFNDDLINERIDNLLKNIEFVYSVNNNNQFSTGVTYDIDSNGRVDRNSGNITKFIIPKTLNELSIYHFGHEQVHALKETNYSEQIYGKTLGEVIPLFYELLIYNPYELLKKELIKFRLSHLLDDKEQYEFFYELHSREWMYAIISDDSELYKRASLYEFIYSKLGCYLNSFYYALILYHMYKENHNKILSLVSNVLNHKMTTFEMLVALDIYGDIRGEIFEKELSNIKKLVR